MKKYVKLEEGETVDGWGEAEMKAIKTYVRTKSGRLIEKTIMVTKDDYDKLQKIMAEGDPSKMAEILGNYMTMEEGATIEGIKKVPQSEPMKVEFEWLNLFCRVWILNLESNFCCRLSKPWCGQRVVA